MAIDNLRKKLAPCGEKVIKKQHGFALIFVMVFIAMIMGIVGDVVYQSQIAAKNTIVQQDQILSKLAVKTGLEFGKFLLVLNKLAAPYQNNPLVPIPKDIYKMLNGQPIGAESFSQIASMTGIDLSQALAPEILNGLKAMKGYFVLNISSENSKFNLNLLQSTYSSTASKALLRLFSNSDTIKLLSLYNYTPQQIVDNLTNYIKLSVTDAALDSRVMGDYNNLKLNYLPKHAALESLEELKRIPGFEVDDIYNMFSPYFTIWPISAATGSLNINSAPTELIASLLTPQQSDIEGSAWDKFDDYRVNKSFEKNNIGEWFKSNLKNYSQDTDADNIRTQLFGVTDFIYKIECRGVYNNIESNYVLIIQQNDTNQAPAAGAPAPQNVSPFNILYSQWIK